MTEKTNLKTLMAGTTTLLMGLNVFVSPVQAAAGQSGAALTEAKTTGTAGKPGDDETKLGASAPISDSGQQGDQNKGGSQSQPQVTSNPEAGDNNTDTKSVTEQSSIYEDNTKVKDGNGNETTIGKVAKEQHENNALGLAGMFGVFAKHTTINADFNSNIATETMNDYGHRTGTRARDNKDSHNLTEEDINYVDKIEQVSSENFDSSNNGQERKEIVILGNDHEVSVDGNRVKINGTYVDHLKNDNLRKESDITSNKKYINIDAEFDELTKRSKAFSDNKENTHGVVVNFTNENNRYIDVANAEADKNNAVYVNLDANDLKADRPIVVKGITKIRSTDGVKGTPVVIINIKTNGIKQLDVASTLEVYDANDQKINNDESHNYLNQVLWNFGNDLSKVNIEHTVSGSILAPNAVLDGGSSNIDGNIVANTVLIGGENHRWDLHHGDSFVEILNPKGDDDTKKPEGDDDTKKPEGDDDTKKPEGDDDTKKPKGDDDTKKPEGDDDTKKPKGDDDAKKPKGDDDTKKPKDETPVFPWFPNPAYPEIPGNENPDQPGDNTPEQPNFFKPQSKTPDQPQTSDSTTPNFSEPKSKTPFPDSETTTTIKSENDVETFFKAQAKSYVVTKKTTDNKNKPVTQAPKIEVELNTAKAVTVATPKSKVERGSVEKVSVKKSAPKAAALPQTGQKQNQSVLIGIALSAVALIVGFFGRAKKN